MIESLSRSGPAPGAGYGVAAASARGPSVAGAADDPASAPDDASDDDGVVASFGGAGDPSPTYGPSGRFDADAQVVAAAAQAAVDPAVDADDAGSDDETDDRTDDDSDAGPADDAPAPNAAARAGTATMVQEYIRVWGGAAPSGGGPDDDPAPAGNDAAASGDAGAAPSLSVMA